MNANGGQNAAAYAGGGSGGSVYLVTQGIEGSGSITANGSYGSGRGADGGEGRIALYYDNGTIDNFSMTTYGATAGEGGNGASGTIYLKGPDNVYGDLIVSNNGQTATARTPISSSLTEIDSLTLGMNVNINALTV